MASGNPSIFNCNRISSQSNKISDKGIIRPVGYGWDGFRDQVGWGCQGIMVWAMLENGFQEISSQLRVDFIRGLLAWELILLIGLGLLEGFGFRILLMFKEYNARIYLLLVYSIYDFYCMQGFYCIDAFYSVYYFYRITSYSISICYSDYDSITIGSCLVCLN